jgi:hypothetical protein
MGRWIESRQLYGSNSPPFFLPHALAAKLLHQLAHSRIGSGFDWNLMGCALAKATGSNTPNFCFIEKAFCIFAFWKNYF